MPAPHRTATMRWLSVLLAPMSMLFPPLVGTGEARAQEATAPRPIRVVETFDPEAGERTRRLARPLSANEILALQEALREAGYLDVFERGSLDEGTRDALRDFQRSAGLDPCGCASYPTALFLGLDPRVILTIVRGTAADRESDATKGGGGVGVEVIYPPSPSSTTSPPSSPSVPEPEREGEGGASAADGATRFGEHAVHPLLWLPGRPGPLGSALHGPFHSPSRRSARSRLGGAPGRDLGPRPPGIRPSGPGRIPLPPIRPPRR